MILITRPIKQAIATQQELEFRGYNSVVYPLLEIYPEHFEVDVSHESLSKTVGLSTPGPVNLEKALRLQDRIGGHLTTGHIDDIGTVVKLEPVGESWQLVVQISKSLARYCAVKGSITINGVSLTVNTVSDHAQGCDIRINLIPHTWQFTTMNLLKIGSRVNVEIDLIARYLQRMLSVPLN